MTSLDDKSTPLQTSQKWGLLRKISAIVLTIFYYIHSFKTNPQNETEKIGHAYFNNKKFCSIASNNHNVIGTQFHPEKSGEIGLEFLETIIKHFQN